MKKIIALIIIGLVVLSIFLTNGFTYINGELNEQATIWIRFIAIIILTTATSCLFIGWAKRLANKTKMIPFKEE